MDILAKNISSDKHVSSEDSKKNLYMTEKGVYITENNDTSSSKIFNLINQNSSNSKNNILCDFISYEDDYEILKNYNRIVLIQKSPNLGNGTNFKQKAVSSSNLSNLVYVIDFNSSCSSNLSSSSTNINMFVSQFERMKFIRMKSKYDQFYSGNSIKQTSYNFSKYSQFSDIFKSLSDDYTDNRNELARVDNDRVNRLFKKAGPSSGFSIASDIG